MLDDENLNWAFGRIEFQAESFLDGRKLRPAD